MNTIELPVQGMTCANCANTIERVLKKVAGVASATVNYASERAQVDYDPAIVKPAELVARVQKAGYGVSLAEIELPLLGMTCANCANSIERAIKKLPGVTAVNVNYASERASLSYIPGVSSLAEVIGAVRKAGYEVVKARDESAVAAGVDTEQAARAAEIEDRKRRMLFGLGFATPAFLLSMSNDFGLLVPALMSLFEKTGAWWLLVALQHYTEHGGHEFHRLLGLMLFVLTLPVMLYSARPYFVHGWNALRNRAANMDVLVALGSGVAFIYSVLVLLDVLGGHFYFETAAVIIALVSVGKWLEARAKGETGVAIKQLIKLAPQAALVLQKQTDGSQREVRVPVSDLQMGDVVIVKPGERVATDGVVIDGRSTVDESMLTGESLPRAKQPGDAVIGATINRDGRLLFEVTKVGGDTALAQIIRLVQRAQGSKAPIQALADRVSAVFVPIVIAIAVLTFLGWWLLGGAGFETALINGISVLLVACPCALGLATPTAIIVGMGKGAEHGILFKNSAVLERAASIKTVVLDKTGTITLGKPVVTGVFPVDAGLNATELLSLMASVEKGSEHPLATAVAKRAELEKAVLQPVQRFLAVPGRGVTAYVNDQQLSIGNTGLMQLQGVDIATPRIGGESTEARLQQLQQTGATVVFAARQGQLLGMVAISDSIKPGSALAIAALKQDGIKVVMMTGDNARSAQTIADSAGVEHVLADLLPADKAQQIGQLQLAGGAVAMVGDGINDAPALAKADVGMAIGTGTDVAMAAADVTLMSGDLSGIHKVIALSRLTVNGIRQNLFWAFVYNLLLIPVAVAGVFQNYGPILAAAAMAFSSLFVISNSLRLRGVKLDVRPISQPLAAPADGTSANLVRNSQS